MRELSIFVDESGDFGEYEKHSPYYIVSMVFHDQADDISEELVRLDRELNNIGYDNPIIHTRPLIRHEDDYANMQPNERRLIFTKLFYFAKRCNIKYKAFVYEKRKYSDIFKLQGRIAQDIAGLIRDNQEFFFSFERVVLYYDNGQQELSKALNIVLSTCLSKYEVKKAMQKDYRLSQVADLICTLEQINHNLENGVGMSKSETMIFHSARSVRKDFIKPLQRKRF